MLVLELLPIPKQTMISSYQNCYKPEHLLSTKLKDRILLSKVRTINLQWFKVEKIISHVPSEHSAQAIFDHNFLWKKVCTMLDKIRYLIPKHGKHFFLNNALALWYGIMLVSVLQNIQNPKQQVILLKKVWSLQIIQSCSKNVNSLNTDNRKCQFYADFMLFCHSNAHFMLLPFFAIFCHFSSF
jgi:hypothetical protein